MNVICQKICTSTNEHVSGSCVIIDDVLLYSTSLCLCLLLLECYMRVIFKYCELFRPGEYDFQLDRFEFVGHNIMTTGNTTAASKYNLITDF